MNWECWMKLDDPSVEKNSNVNFVHIRWFIHFLLNTLFTAIFINCDLTLFSHTDFCFLHAVTLHVK